jgi:hypothetical protein
VVQVGTYGPYDGLHCSVVALWEMNQYPPYSTVSSPTPELSVTVTDLPETWVRGRFQGVLHFDQRPDLVISDGTFSMPLIRHPRCLCASDPRRRQVIGVEPGELIIRNGRKGKR